jgi:DNA-directed RNA polymerase specialized sigma24 family protein
MREYRRRKAAGEVEGTYRRTTPDDLRRMVELRLQGLTYREIGEELGMDHSYVARLTKSEMAEGRGPAPQG